MRLYNQAHAFYAGVDLQARTMFTHVLDQRGRTVFEHDLPANPEAFLEADDRADIQRSRRGVRQSPRLTEVSIPPEFAAGRRYPAGVELAVLPGRLVGTEKFLRRH